MDHSLEEPVGDFETEDIGFPQGLRDGTLSSNDQARGIQFDAHATGIHPRQRDDYPDLAGAGENVHRRLPTRPLGAGVAGLKETALQAIGALEHRPRSLPHPRFGIFGVRLSDPRVVLGHG